MSENIHFKIEGGYQYHAIRSGVCFQKSWHLLKYDMALQLLQIKSTDKVLDAACGSGVLTEMMAEKHNAEITGVDFSEAAIRFCKHQYSHPRLKFFTADLQEKIFEPNTFDKIVMLETIEHLVPEVAANILSNLYSYLKPGGSLILSTPNKRSLWPAIEFTLDTLRLTPKMKDEQHVKLYNKISLRKVLSDAGLQVKQITTSHFLAPWLSILGLKTAEKLHAAEQKIKIFPGSLLFAVATK